MRFIPTRIHGIFDYLIGVLLVATPWLFGFAHGGPETWVPIILGIGILIYSLFTNYELGGIRTIPMPVHLWLDGIAGAFLALSPWLFGFHTRIFAPHLTVGLLEIFLALTTRLVPEYEARQAPHSMA